MIPTKMIKLTDAVKEYGIPKTTFELAIRNQELNVYSFRDKDRYLKRIELEAWIATKIVRPVELIRSRNFSLREVKNA